MYKKPELSVERFEVEDIITTSGTPSSEKNSDHFEGEQLSLNGALNII